MIPAIDDTRRRGPRERPWTAENDRTLLALRNAGMTMAVAGERLNRTESACFSRVAKITREDSPLNPFRDDLGNKIEAFMLDISKTRGFPIETVKRAFGWR